MSDNYYKVSSNYLTNISSHLDEKTKFIVSAVENNKIPLIGCKVFMLEVGIGGGQTVCALKNRLNEKINITAIDVYPKLIEAGNKLGIKSLLADVCDLPFNDSSFSCVNVASVLHEVSSYGHTHNGSVIYGVEAVKSALKEIKRVLCPSGMFFYRDVLAPDKNETKEVNYKSSTWKFFIDYFLLDFIDSGPAFYKNNYLFKRHANYYSITAQSSLHREIQKHYILWMSGLMKAFPEEYGFVGSNMNLIDGYLYVERKISKMNRDDELFKKTEKNLQNWLLREGKEHYLYWSVDEILDYCSNDIDNKGMALLQKRKDDIIKLVRNEENEYLRKVIVNPEIEGKQVINFTKIAINKQCL